MQHHLMLKLNNLKLHVVFQKTSPVPAFTFKMFNVPASL